MAAPCAGSGKRCGKLLEKVSSVFFALNAANTSAEMQEIGDGHFTVCGQVRDAEAQETDGENVPHRQTRVIGNCRRCDVLEDRAVGCRECNPKTGETRQRSDVALQPVLDAVAIAVAE